MDRTDSDLVDSGGQVNNVGIFMFLKPMLSNVCGVPVPIVLLLSHSHQQAPCYEVVVHNDFWVFGVCLKRCPHECRAQSLPAEDFIVTR